MFFFGRSSTATRSRSCHSSLQLLVVELSCLISVLQVVLPLLFFALPLTLQHIYHIIVLLPFFTAKNRVSLVLLLVVMS